MSGNERATKAGAQQSADRLAVALEEVGFDVGQEFPALHDAIGRQGVPVVRLGDVRPSTADQLAAVLTRAAAHGITMSREEDS